MKIYKNVLCRNRSDLRNAKNSFKILKIVRYIFKHFFHKISHIDRVFSRDLNSLLKLTGWRRATGVSLCRKRYSESSLILTNEILFYVNTALFNLPNMRIFPIQL